jgi:excisionase family DNA binding protein
VAFDSGSPPALRTLLIEQAAAIMGVSRRTVYYRIREGRLETIRTRCGSRRVVVRSLETLVLEGIRKNAAAGAKRRA